MNNYTVERAVAEDLDAIMSIFSSARAYMTAQGNPQWQDGFPQREFIEGRIRNKVMYKIMCGGDIAAVFSMLDADSDYDKIDGKWLTDGSYFAVHNVAVAENYRGKGCARYMFAHVLNEAAARGKDSVRVDTHEKNLPMRTLLNSLGFSCCGIVLVGGNKIRIAFEKLVK